MANHTCKFPLSRVVRRKYGIAVQRKPHFMKNHSKSWIWPKDATQPLCTVLSKEFAKMNYLISGNFYGG